MSRIEEPGGFTPQEALAFDNGSGKAQRVSAANPLPVAPNPFLITGDTVNINVSSSSQRVALGTVSSQVEVYNDGTAVSFIAFGDNAVTTTATAGKPVAPGAMEVLSVPAGATHVAAIAAGSTGKIYFTPGEGI